MKGLILKDLLNIKKSSKTFLFVIAFYIIFSVSFNNSSFLSGIIIMLFSLMTISSFSYDNIAKWDRYALSLPISKKDMVLSKYILSIIMIAVGAVLSIVLTFAIILYKNSNTSVIQEQFITSYSVFFIAVILISVLLPLIYKFGVEKSRLLLFSVIIIPAIIIVALSKLGVRLPSQNALELVLKISPIIIAIVFYVSFLISYKIYKSTDV